MKFSPCTIAKVEIGGQTIVLVRGNTKIKQSLTNTSPLGSFSQNLQVKDTKQLVNLFYE